MPLLFSLSFPLFPFFHRFLVSFFASCIHVEGKLVESAGKGQTMEVQAEMIELYGTADPEVYPLQKKGHSMEFLREIAHLRPRTNYFGCVLRLRHAMAFAIHKYFNDAFDAGDEN